MAKETDKKTVTEKICNCCGRNKKIAEFYQSNSFANRYSGTLPICKTCVGKIYDEYYRMFESEKVAMYYTCLELNVCFNSSMFNAARDDVRLKEKCTPFWRGYMQKLNSIGKKNKIPEGSRYSDSLDDVQESENGEDEVFTASKEVINRWGEGFRDEDYQWLEQNYAEWYQNNDAEKMSVQRLLQMICVKELEIRNARKAGVATDKLEKSLRELMNDTNLTPRNMSVNNESDSTKTFGLWIKDVEKYKPAEYFEDKSIYHDFDGIKEYFDRFIMRPMKNLLTGSRDFDGEFNIEKD